MPCPKEGVWILLHSSVSRNIPLLQVKLNLTLNPSRTRSMGNSVWVVILEPFHYLNSYGVPGSYLEAGKQEKGLESPPCWNADFRNPWPFWWQPMLLCCSHLWALGLFRKPRSSCSLRLHHLLRGGGGAQGPINGGTCEKSLQLTQLKWWVF